MAIHEEIAGEIRRAAAAAPDPWQALHAGCDAFLAAAARPDVQRILLLDAPAVLGWEEWSRLDRAHGFGLLLNGVRRAAEEGYLRTENPEALAVLLNGAINDGVIWAAGSQGNATRARELRDELHRLLDGLRAR